MFVYCELFGVAGDAYRRHNVPAFLELPESEWGGCGRFAPKSVNTRPRRGRKLA